MSITARVSAVWAIVLLSAPLPSGAAESPDGKALHEQRCTKCHTAEIYTREDRKVTSYEGLQRQVQRCETALGLQWFDEDIAAVVAYLNRDYYRFMPPQ
jgi:mono/diheme cytochrome c family protein